jgi:hypothetical protein
VVAALAGLVALPPAASAAPPATLWVAPPPIVVSSAVSNAPATVTTGTSCANPGYHTIQSAIAAAPAGATINICAGTYVEQLTITQSVSLVGVGAATVELPASPANSTTACDTAPGTGSYQPDQDGIAICGAATVNINNLTIDPAWTSSPCDDSLYGILVGGGATLNLSNSSVTAGGAVPINGCQGGVAVQVGMAWTTPNEVGHATLTNDRISGYQKNGITVDGAGSSGTIVDTTVTGAGPTTQIAQNGIQISNGAFGLILDSTVTGNECDNATCGADAMNDYQAGGVLFYGAAAGSSVTGSTISDNDYGVYNEETTATAPKAPAAFVTADTLTNNRYEGVLLDQGWAAITGDTITGGDVGIQVLQYFSTNPAFASQAYGANGTATLDAIHGASVAAVQIYSDRATGDPHGTLSVSLSDLRGNAARVLNNSLNYTVLQLLNL